MEIDTNGFNIRLSEHAFEGAAILVSMGADAIIKQNLLKESKRDFLKKADYIKSSYIYHKQYAICLLYTGISKQDELAEISESLLNFEDVEASFTIGQLSDGKVGISARSIGNIDVCEYMKALGGGGHATNAAAQIDNTTIKATEKSLKKVLGD
jgi:c-di-AMP phosphodiesterase-like protein